MVEGLGRKVGLEGPTPQFRGAGGAKSVIGPYHRGMAHPKESVSTSESSAEDPLKRLLPGRFIVLDGPDGSGKSTQFQRLSVYCAQLDVAVEEVREPGGTSIGEEIRRILLDPANDKMVVRTEMLLYMASRAQLLAERIGPALEANRLVLADRFVSSTLAYQGTAGGLSQEEIAQVGEVTMGQTRPDLVVIFDLRRN